MELWALIASDKIFFAAILEKSESTETLWLQVW